MIRRPPRSTPFPTRRSSDLAARHLKKVMGPLAPTATELLAFEMRLKTPANIVSEYTDSVGFDSDELFQLINWLESREEKARKQAAKRGRSALAGGRN